MSLNISRIRSHAIQMENVILAGFKDDSEKKRFLSQLGAKDFEELSSEISYIAARKVIIWCSDEIRCCNKLKQEAKAKCSFSESVTYFFNPDGSISLKQYDDQIKEYRLIQNAFNKRLTQLSAYFTEALLIDGGNRLSIYEIGDPNIRHIRLKEIEKKASQLKNAQLVIAQEELRQYLIQDLINVVKQFIGSTLKIPSIIDPNSTKGLVEAPPTLIGWLSLPLR